MLRVIGPEAGEDHQVFDRTHQRSSKVGFASLLIAEVLRNLSDFELRVVQKNHEEEKNASAFFEAGSAFRNRGDL
ncbi:MAG: hypothetical protein LUO98_04460 [Methanoregula sp.]|nr:hypothetical protein [Methanoregula sp.]